MNFIAKIVGIVFMILIVSCGHNLKLEDILNNEKEFELKIPQGDPYTSNKSIIKTIKQDSEKILKLKNWFKNNPYHWHSSIASYILPEYTLIGNDFRLLVYKNFIVIGFKDKEGHAQQYTKQINKLEFDFLLEKL